MQKVKYLQEQLFLECRDIVENLSKLQNKEDFIRNHKIFSILSEKVKTMEFLSQNEHFFLTQEPEKKNHIIEEKPHTIEEISPMENTSQNQNSGEKIKLAKIKDLKPAPIPEPKSLPRLPDFRLDINDTIGFSKMLFGGSQNELNMVVNTINKMTDLEDARSYLSEIYYEKNWHEVEDFAQRLWILVENRFS